MGCHLVREVALSRALTEAAQARLTVISGSRDDNGRRRYKDLSHTSHTDLDDKERERLSRPGPRPFDAAPTFVGQTLEEDLERLLDAVRGVGLEHVIAVDLTRPEYGIPVVRVVVPGLETYHHAQGYVPGLRARRALDALKIEEGS
jgi:ribosomal protein S12 methylthiotransferase accessory factor